MNINWFALSGLLTCISSLAFGIFSWVKGRKFLNKIWAIFNFAVALWGFGAFKFSTTLDQASVFFWLHIGHIGVVLLPVFFLHFVHEFLELKKPKLLLAVYVIGAIFSLANLTDFTGLTKLFIVHLRYVFNSFYVDSPPGILYPFFVAFFFGIIGYAHYEALKHLRAASGLKRVQIKYFLVATALGFSGGGTAFFMVFNIDVYPFLHWTIPLYPVIMTYAIVRYRLMDITVAITRGGIFATVYLIVLGLPIALATWWRHFLEAWAGESWWMIPLGSMAVLGTAGPSLYLYFQRRAEARLLREQRQYQATLLQASTGMTQIRDLKHLLRLIVHILTRTVHIQHAGIFLRDEEMSQFTLKSCRDHHRFPQDTVLTDTHPLIRWFSTHTEPLVTEEVKLHLADVAHELTSQELHTLLRWLEQLHLAVIVPSFIANRLLGLVVLGPKRTGAIYSQDDLRVFTTLANQAALAIDNCLFYEKLKETQTQLFQADKMGSIGQLASGIAHEINNPATVISGEAQLWLEELKRLRHRLSESAYSPTAAEFDALVNRLDEQFTSNVQEVERIKEIIRRVLRYSKKGGEAFGAVDLKVVIEDALGLVRLQFKEVAPHLEWAPDLPPVDGNVTQLQEIFLNLAINACQAMTDERRKVAHRDLTIRAAVDGDMVKVEVEDTGMGIPATKLSKIWEAFYTTKQSGTGLGLYLVYGIIQQHHGTITVHSTEGQGTTFTVRLPIHRATTTPMRQPTTT